jgi:hypothetical protein
VDSCSSCHVGLDGPNQHMQIKVVSMLKLKKCERVRRERRGDEPVV